MNVSIIPPVVGGLTMAIGGLSVLTCLSGSQAIINTPLSNGFDVVASIVVMGIGYKIFKSGSALLAIFWLVIAALLTNEFRPWQVDTAKAVSVTQSIGSNLVNAAASASDQMTKGIVKDQPSVIPAEYRPLTNAERQWCSNNPSDESVGCVKGYCRIADCGTKGE